MQSTHTVSTHSDRCIHHHKSLGAAYRRVSRQRALHDAIDICRPYRRMIMSWPTTKNGILPQAKRTNRPCAFTWTWPSKTNPSDGSSSAYRVPNRSSRFTPKTYYDSRHDHDAPWIRPVTTSDARSTTHRSTSRGRRRGTVGHASRRGPGSRRRGSTRGTHRRHGRHAVPHAPTLRWRLLRTRVRRDRRRPCYRPRTGHTRTTIRSSRRRTRCHRSRLSP